MKRLAVTTAAVVAIAAISLTVGGVDRDRLDRAIAGADTTPSPLSTAPLMSGSLTSDPLTSDPLTSGPAKPSRPMTKPWSGSGGEAEGTFDPAAPFIQMIELQAGDAVRATLISTSGEYPEPGSDFGYGLSLAVAVPEELAGPLDIGDWIDGGFSNDNFFSDYPRDEDWQAVGLPSPYETVARQYDVVWASDDGLLWRDSPPQYACAGRLEASGPAVAAWAVFVAPTTATYTVIAAGLGDFELVVDVQPAEAAESTGAAELPAEPGEFFETADYESLVAAHQEFLFDPDFYPADRFAGADESSPFDAQRCRADGNDD